MSQHIHVAQQFHSEHYVHMLDLLSTHRGWFYGCAQNTQDWLSTSRLTTEIMDQGFEAFRSFWIHWLYTLKTGLHTSWLPFRMLGYWPYIWRYLLLRHTALLSEQTTRHSEILEKQPIFWFLACTKFLHGKKRLRNPVSRATPQILRSPKFKKGCTYLAHPEWFSSSPP